MGKILLIIWQVFIGILLHYKTVEFQQNPKKLSLGIMMLINIEKPSVVVEAHEICNNYFVVCPPVFGVEPQALVSGSSPVQADNHGITVTV